jgi:hypothetical protein
MSKALALFFLVSSAAFAQAKIPQRPIASDCISGTLKANGVTVCNLRDAMSSIPLVRIGNHTEQLDLTSGPDDNPGMGWVGLESLKNSLWVGVLDWQVESPGPELVVVTSTDAGKSWTRAGVVTKPHYTGLFRALKLKTAREWTLELVVEDCAGCGEKPGVRVYETHDAGAHWALRR